MKFEIKNRWSGAVQYSCELSAEVAGQAYGLQLGFAIKKAVAERADLTRADLTRADLTRAVLTGTDLTDAVLTRAVLTRAVLTGTDLTRAVLTRADLTRAVLTRADLTRAVLTGTDLTDAVLTRAVLTGTDLTDAVLTRAVLTGTDLTRAVLTRADLTRAVLTRADLTRAVLTDAVLTRAVLTRAVLTGTDLTRAVLTRADLTAIRDDVWAVLCSAPREAYAVRDALAAGRVDGSTYSGSCSCLVGTIATARGVAHDEVDGLQPSSSRPAERFFMAIQEGHTPENSQPCAIAHDWVCEFITRMEQAFGGADEKTAQQLAELDVPTEANIPITEAARMNVPQQIGRE